MSISCPGCQSATVLSPSWSFSDTSVAVAVCDSCQSSGLQSITVKVSGLLALEVPTYSVRHRDGLATFN